MKALLTVLALALLVSFFGCQVNPSKFSRLEAQEFASRITYVKDSCSGLCFGVVASRKTGEVSQSGLGMTVVPCEKVKHLLGQ